MKFGTIIIPPLYIKQSVKIHTFLQYVINSKLFDKVIFFYHNDVVVCSNGVIFKMIELLARIQFLNLIFEENSLDALISYNF